MIWLGGFVAALFLIALPQALFRRNEAAAAVFVAWCLGQLAYTAGLPEALMQTIIYAGAFSLLCIRIALKPNGWSWRCVLVALLFLPLAELSRRWWYGAPEPYWEIYWTGVVQMALLARPVAWLRAVHGWTHRQREVWDDHFSMVAR